LPPHDSPVLVSAVSSEIRLRITQRTEGTRRDQQRERSIRKHRSLATLCTFPPDYCCLLDRYRHHSSTRSRSAAARDVAGEHFYRARETACRKSSGCLDVCQPAL